MPNTFRHPPPKARTATIRVKRSFFGACRTEVVKLAGVSLSGQASEEGEILWKLVLYDCKIKGVINKNMIIVGAKRLKLRLIYPNVEEYKAWLESITTAIGWRLKHYYGLETQCGAGQYAKVFKGTFKEDSTKVAVKEVIKAENVPKILDFVEREYKIMEVVDHPNVIKTMDVFDEPDRLYIVLEFMEGGMLFDVLKREKRFSEKDASNVMKDVFLGLEYLHRQGIVHRDIKPDNILCANTTKPLNVKIADFGLSNFLQMEEEGDTDGTLASGVGTPYYVAPEMIAKKKYGPPVDLWSCGVLLYILLSGRFPFVGFTKENTLQKIKAGVYYFPEQDWAEVSDEAKDLVKQLLTKDPKVRITAAEGLKHAWIAEEGNVRTVNLGINRISNAFQLTRAQSKQGSGMRRDKSKFFKSLEEVQEDNEASLLQEKPRLMPSLSRKLGQSSSRRSSFKTSVSFKGFKD